LYGAQAQLNWRCRQSLGGSTSRCGCICIREFYYDLEAISNYKSPHSMSHRQH